MHVSPGRLHCRSTGGQCLDYDEGKFRCAYRGEPIAVQHTYISKNLLFALFYFFLSFFSFFFSWFAFTYKRLNIMINYVPFDLCIPFIYLQPSQFGILLVLIFYLRRKFIISIFWDKQTGKHQNIEVFLRNHGSLTPKDIVIPKLKK